MLRPLWTQLLDDSYGSPSVPYTSICSFYFQHISILIGCLFDLLLSLYVEPRCQKEREKNENQRTKDSAKVSLIVCPPWQVTLEAKYLWFSLVTII